VIIGLRRLGYMFKQHELNFLGLECLFIWVRSTGIKVAKLKIEASCKIVKNHKNY